MTKAIERGAEEQGRRLRYPPEAVAAVMRGVMNGLSFERAVDPGVLPDDIVAFAMSTLLQAASDPSG